MQYYRCKEPRENCGAIGEECVLRLPAWANTPVRCPYTEVTSNEEGFVEWELTKTTPDAEEDPKPSGRFCYTILDSSRAEDGQYIPVAVYEGKPGYYPMTGSDELAAPWKWGNDYNKALKTAKEMNERMGLSEEEVDNIIASSMRATA
jgi:hypothetical protein